GEEVSHSDGRPLCRRRGRSLKRAPVGGGCTPRHRARRRRVTDQCPMRLQPQSTRGTSCYRCGRPGLRLLSTVRYPFPTCRNPSYSSCSQALGCSPSLLLRMANVLELQSFLYVRPTGLFASQVAPTLPSHTPMRVRQPRLLRPRISRLVARPAQRLC